MWVLKKPKISQRTYVFAFVLFYWVFTSNLDVKNPLKVLIESAHWLPRYKPRGNQVHMMVAFQTSQALCEMHAFRPLALK